MTQLERTEIMNKFRQGVDRVLVTTDLLARGIDVQQVNVVINYDIPRSFEAYLHRIGRTGRYQKTGVTINFLIPSDAVFLTEVEEYFGTS